MACMSIRSGAGVAGATVLLALVAGCTSSPPTPTETPTLNAKQADRDRLAGVAAAAKDKRYVATYTLSAAGRADRTVTVAVATDGSWVVAIPGGALGGYADIAVFRSASGVFQCALPLPAATRAARPDISVTVGCVALPKLTAGNDPMVQHLFTDWIDAFVNRDTALSVAIAPALPGSQGTCFSVESNSAALAPPVDPGIYCYETDGVLTGARVGFGTLVLAGAVGAAPPSVTMPGSMVNRAPLGLTAPPPPPPSPTGTPGPRS
jgi:hypothetical protein